MITTIAPEEDRRLTIAARHLNKHHPHPWEKWNKKNYEVIALAKLLKSYKPK